MWGGNSSYIDILIKAKSVQKVSQKLKENNIQYELLIFDLQKAIDEENPSILEEETDDRQGKLKKKLFFVLNCLCMDVFAIVIVYSEKTTAKIFDSVAWSDSFRE